MPKKKDSVNMYSSEEIALKGIQYSSKKASIKELDSECKELRKPLEKFVDSVGTTLSSGSKLAVVSYADKDVHLKKTLRVSKVLLPEAMDVIRENGLEKCIENVPTIREDVLEMMYEKGEVSMDVLKKIYADKAAYAFSVEVKDKMEDAPTEG